MSLLVQAYDVRSLVTRVTIGLLQLRHRPGRYGQWPSRNTSSISTYVSL